MSVVVSVLHTLQFLVCSRAVLHLEILARWHQSAVANRSHRPRLRFTTVDRVLWAWLSQRWHGWSAALHVVEPATVLAWHRCGFAFLDMEKSTSTGRPGVPADVRARPRQGHTDHAPGLTLKEWLLGLERAVTRAICRLRLMTMTIPRSSNLQAATDRPSRAINLSRTHLSRRLRHILVTPVTLTRRERIADPDAAVKPAVLEILRPEGVQAKSFGVRP